MIIYISYIKNKRREMQNMAKGKTPEYMKRAINNYNQKFDRIAVNLEKGSKEWIKENTGKSCNQFFIDLFNEYKKRIEEQNT